MYGPTAMLQINLRLKSGEVVVLTTDGTWQAFNGDTHRKPDRAYHGGSVGTGFVEYIDAREEPVGWMLPGYQAEDGWPTAVGKEPSTSQQQNLHAKIGRPMQVYDVSVKSIRAIPAPPPTPPAFPVSCGVAAEGWVLVLQCPDKANITGVKFASFGLPTGSY